MYIGGFFSIMQGKGFINFVDGAKMIELNQLKKPHKTPISVNTITMYKHTELTKEDRAVIKSIFLCMVKENVYN